jgi:hypothetical protein
MFPHFVDVPFARAVIRKNGIWTDEEMERLRKLLSSNDDDSESLLSEAEDPDPFPALCSGTQGLNHGAQHRWTNL